MDRGERWSGVEPLGKISWGTHICQLYETEADLLAILAAYMKAGLDQGEYCLWTTSGDAQQGAIKAAMSRVMPDLDQVLAAGRLELINQADWYYNEAGELDLAATARESMTRLKKALAGGFAGMRLAGSGHWRSRAEWAALIAYERGINHKIDAIPVISICCYPLVRLSPMDIAEVVSTHHCALIKQSGVWRVVENSDHHQTHERARESKEQETRLRQEMAARAEKMQAIGTLAGGIAHDFNNLLGVILGNVSFALQNLDPPEELKELLTDVRAGAGQAQSLTQQLLTFAEGGEPIKEPTALPALVKEAAMSAASGSNVQCEVLPIHGLPMAYVDPGQVSQIVHNLVENAAQAMPDGGQLRIWFETMNVQPGDATDMAPGRYLVVSFQDEGPGIPEEHLGRIFEPYFTTRQNGHGLGLAMVFSVARRHGGKVTVASPPGEGATFRLYLPTSGTVEVFPTDQETQVPRRKVLVMDDQLPVQRMLTRILDRLGMEHAVAADGASAVDLYRAAMERGHAFDLVILDLTVPAGLGGQETIKLLRELDPEVRAVVSSGYANDPVMARYEEHGFAGVLPKPYTFKQFQGLLQDMLGRS